MGGSSSKVTVGYRYALGVHMTLCHGPVDAVREILVDKRVAWSVLTSGGAAAGAGAAVETRLGAIAGASAVAGLAGETTARVLFPGTFAGVRIGQEYRLRLADASSRSVIVESIALDPVTGVTTWRVQPVSLSFLSQAIEVFETTGGASNAGAGGGRIRIDAPSLFGGESREGGIVGDVDILMGGPGQGANDYLAARMGGPVPGFRGLCSVVLRQVYLGINPYLKPWAFRVTRVLTGEAGAPQWYPARASIVSRVSISDSAIYIALDVSGSMSGARMAAQKAAVATLIREIAEEVDPDRPNDIRIVLWSDAVVGSIERRNAGPADYDALEAFMLGLSNTTTGGTAFDAGVSEAAAFFAGSSRGRRILLFVTDGEPFPPASVDTAEGIVRSLSQVDTFGFNIALADTSFTARLDNTPVDGVPVVPAGDSQALVSSLRGAFGVGPDMNPAHIIRECLTNRDWGLGYGSPEIGASFTAAADTLFFEGFGLSFLWQQDSSVEEFIVSVLEHIDATLYVDRRTGLWELRLIRPDYDPATVLVLDDASVVDWGRLGRRLQSELVNSVTVRFSDPETDEDSAVTVTDTARVQEMGEVIATTVDYPGIRAQNLAVRVCERDLRSLSAPLLSGEITVSRAAAGLNPGDVVRLVSPRRGLDGPIMRISEIGQGDGRANGIRLRLAEDVFALGATAIAGGRSQTGSSLSSVPRALLRRYVAEASYWLLVRELGDAEASRILTDNPAAGALVATGEKPGADAIAAAWWIDPGPGPVQDGTVAFAPTAVLAEDLSAAADARTVDVSGWVGLSDVAVGTLASIGGELVRVDGLSSTSITVGRGCLDTVPRAHPAGTPVVFFDPVVRLSEGSYVATETLSVRLLPETGRGSLAFALAPEDIVTLDRRALRPLPPGNFRADGAFEGVFWSGAPLAFTWAHRDRLTQTSPVVADHLAGNIGPEAGTTYTLSAVALSEAGTELGSVFSQAGITGTSRTLEAADLSALPASTFALRWSLASSRGGLASREAATLVLPLPPRGLLRIGSPDELDPPAAVLIGDAGRVRWEE